MEIKCKTVKKFKKNTDLKKIRALSIIIILNGRFIQCL